MNRLKEPEIVLVLNLLLIKISFVSAVPYLMCWGTLNRSCISWLFSFLQGQALIMMCVGKKVVERCMQHNVTGLNLGLDPALLVVVVLYISTASF